MTKAKAKKGRPPKPDEFPMLVIRLDKALLDEFDAKLKRQAFTGEPLNRSAAVRQAMRLWIMASPDMKEKK